jgi:hypothetical protein
MSDESILLWEGEQSTAQGWFDALLRELGITARDLVAIVNEIAREGLDVAALAREDPRRLRTLILSKARKRRARLSERDLDAADLDLRDAIVEEVYRAREERLVEAISGTLSGYLSRRVVRDDRPRAIQGHALNPRGTSYGQDRTFTMASSRWPPGNWPTGGALGNVASGSLLTLQQSSPWSAPGCWNPDQETGQ